MNLIGKGLLFGPTCSNCISCTDVCMHFSGGELPNADQLGIKWNYRNGKIRDELSRVHGNAANSTNQ